MQFAAARVYGAGLRLTPAPPPPRLANPARRSTRHLLHKELPLRYEDNVRCFYKSATGTMLPVDS